MLTTHLYLGLGPIVAVAGLFTAERYLGRLCGLLVAALVVPAAILALAWLIYGVNGGVIYAISVIPIYYIGLAFGWRYSRTCTGNTSCSKS